MIPEKQQLFDLNKRVWELIPPSDLNVNQTILLDKLTESILNTPEAELRELSLLDRLNFINEHTKTVTNLRSLNLEASKIENEIERQALDRQLDKQKEYQNSYLDKINSAIFIYIVLRANIKNSNSSMEEEIDLLRQCLKFLNEVRISETAGID